MESQRSCQREKLKGSQIPSVRICPDYEYTDGDDAIKLLKLARLTPDEWQENVICDWMGMDDGEWTATAGGLSVPRQNGKTLITIGRIGAGMILYNEWVVYTAHNQKTATETFKELKDLFETKALKKYVDVIKEALGREEIRLKSGARCMFVARTRNGGRGFHGDLLVFDEAQELTDAQQASFTPVLAASKNPQTIYLGTPPDENCVGDVFRNFRKKVTTEEVEDAAWTEFSVSEIGDVNDRKRWAEANPALGKRIKEKTVASELAQMAPDTFARERLGWWSEYVESIDYAIKRDKWNACASESQRPEGKTAYGIKFSPDGSEVALCGAVCPLDGPARISLIEKKSTGHGIQWLADWLNLRYKTASCVVIDGRNGVELLIDKIKDTWKLKGSIVKPSSKDVIASATQLVNEINEQTVTWYRYQEILDRSATTATKRPISGGWGFGGDDSIPIEACALALWGCRTSKRDPSKKMRIG